MSILVMSIQCDFRLSNLHTHRSKISRSTPPPCFGWKFYGFANSFLKMELNKYDVCFFYEPEEGEEYHKIDLNDQKRMFRAIGTRNECKGFPYVEEIRQIGIYKNGDNIEIFYTTPKYDNISNDGSLDDNEKKKIILQFAHAIKFLHSKSIVCRIQSEECIKMNGGDIVITDFINSKIMNEKESSATQIGGGGTGLLENPFRSDETIEEQTSHDVYSIGKLTEKYFGSDGFFKDFIKNCTNVVKRITAAEACEWLDNNLKNDGTLGEEIEKIHKIEKEYQKSHVMPEILISGDPFPRNIVPQKLCSNDEDSLKTVHKIFKMASQCDSHAMELLGFMYEFGFGIPEDLFLAYYWYSKYDAMHYKGRISRKDMFEEKIKESKFGKGVITEYKAYNEKDKSLLKEALQIYKDAIETENDPRAAARYAYILRNTTKIDCIDLMNSTFYKSHYPIMYIPLIYFKQCEQNEKIPLSNLGTILACAIWLKNHNFYKGYELAANVGIAILMDEKIKMLEKGDDIPDEIKRSLAIFESRGLLNLDVEADGFNKIEDLIKFVNDCQSIAEYQGYDKTHFDDFEKLHNIWKNVSSTKSTE